MGILEIIIIAVSFLGFLSMIAAFVIGEVKSWKREEASGKKPSWGNLGPPPQGGSGVKDDRPETIVYVFIEKEKDDEAKN
jgi:hypothetical protein